MIDCVVESVRRPTFESCKSATWAPMPGPDLTASLYGKNFNLMHDESGEVRLAPLYDVACHVIRPGHPVDPAMWINGVSSVHTVTTQDLVREAATWKVRLNERQAHAVVIETLELMRSELAEAERDVSVDEQVVETVNDRIDALLAGRSAGEAT